MNIVKIVQCIIRGFTNDVVGNDVAKVILVDIMMVKMQAIGRIAVEYVSMSDDANIRFWYLFPNIQILQNCLGRMR